MTRPRISLYDESSLGWFFGEGVAAFERSTFGSMLDRQALFAIEHEVRPEVIVARFARKPHEPPVFEVEARPGPHKHQASGYTPDETHLARYARVSRRLRAVTEQSALSALVLEAYYGDQGVRWGRTSHGRIYAVCALTDAGLEVLRRANERARAVRLGQSADDSLRAELDVQRVQPQPVRAALLERARRQAVALYDRASEHWDEASRRVRANEGRGKSYASGT